MEHASVNKPTQAPLYAQSPTARFSDRAQDYVQFRPTYPSTAIDAMLLNLPIASVGRLLAADIGAGTGISARLLGDRGVRVIAIEPNAEMRAAAMPHPMVEWRQGTAEATHLDDASMDLVCCAQAFHWFRPAEALREFARVLRPGGRVVLMWNDRSKEHPFTREYTKIVMKASDNHAAARDDEGSATPLRDSDLFVNARRYEFAHEQPLSLEALIGRVVSSSYAPKEGEAHDTMVRELTELHKRFTDRAGLVRLRYHCRVHVGQRP